MTLPTPKGGGFSSGLRRPSYLPGVRRNYSDDSEILDGSTSCVECFTG